MKNIFLLFLSAIFFACNSSAANDRTTINGTLKGQDNATLYVSYTDDKGYQSDEVAVSSGKFEWTVPIGFPTSVSFSLSKRAGQPSEAAAMWTDPGVMELILDAGDISNYTLTGSKTNEMVKAFEKQFEAETAKMQELVNIFQDGNTPEEEVARARTEYRAVSDEVSKKRLDFIKQHPDSYFSASMLSGVTYGMAPEEVAAWLDILTGDAADSHYARKMRQELQGEIDGRVGAKAPMFSGTDIDGQQFDLVNLIGDKYIIVDFWASWCVPCRAGNPHLKDLYAKYRDDGLVVVCVADNDSEPDKWRKAVAEDGIEEFTHVLRGWGGMENFFDRRDISVKYGIHSLPTKILIDKNGVIVGRYGGGGEPSDAMDAKLAEIFGR